MIQFEKGTGQETDNQAHVRLSVHYWSALKSKMVDDGNNNRAFFCT